MSLIPARTLIDALEAALRAIPLSDDDPSGEKLFEVVERYGNRNLGAALADLVITKGRVCLIVPLGVSREHDRKPSHRVLSQRSLEVDLLIADRAYYKAGQVAVFGGEKNLGVMEMAERVEEALEGKELSDDGPAIFDDGAQQTLSDPQKKDTPGREVWIQSLLIPAGSIETVCF